MWSNLKSKGFLLKDYMYSLALEERVADLTTYFWAKIPQKMHIVNVIRIVPTVIKRSYLFRCYVLDLCVQDGESRQNHYHVHPPTTVLHL